MNPPPGYFTIDQACEKLRITRTGLNLALREHRIEPTKFEDKWYFTQDNLDNFKTKRYKRSKSKLPNGELMFDKAKNYYSVPEAAKLFNVPVLRIYYLVRKKKLPSFRVNCTHVVIIEDKEQLAPMVQTYFRKKDLI